MNQVAVLVPDEEFQTQAENLAERLQLPLIKKPDESPFYLTMVDGQWGLCCRELSDLKPLVVDFQSGDWKRRRQKIKGAGDILSRALGKVKGRKAVDATAGLGKDSLHLLALGFQVIAVERSPALAFLLEAAREKALSDEGVGSELESLQIVTADACCYLPELYSREGSPDVVFLDPMFPHKKKSALSGKEMQIFQHLFDYQPEKDRELLRASVAAVSDRVVVKRPLSAPPILTGARHQYSGKSVRYDVYFPGDRLSSPEEGS